MWFRSSNIGALLLAVLVLAACTKPAVVNDGCAGSYAWPHESYTLGPGDELSIVVSNHEDLSGNFVVSEAGTISLPLVGEIRAVGRTTNAVGQDYSDLLANGFLVNPNVTVCISQYRPFFIIGGVKNPGAYPYRPGMTILHAIAIAGGLSPLGDRVALPRLMPPWPDRDLGPFTLNRPVFPGDVIEIPERATGC